MTLRTLHVYGGLLTAVVGLSFLHIAAGLVAGGAALVWLGLTWVRE